MERTNAETLERAFELAFFLQGERETALATATEALDRLDRFVIAQHKRRYYRPATRRGRNRVSLRRAQLLQLLVLILSERYEKAQEARGESYEDDMTIRFIARLVRSGLRRNAFHVAVGVGRLLFDFTTAETLSLYDLVTQDPDRGSGEDYVRARKKVLFGELRERFGDLLPVHRGAHGELRFSSCEMTAKRQRLTTRCRELLVPWRTRCVLPEDLGPITEIPALAFDGHPDDQHPIERNRIHALLHPRCFERLAAPLRLAAAASDLRLPDFQMSRRDDAGDDDQGGGPPEERRGEPRPIGDDERRGVLAELARRDELRRRLGGHHLTLRVDGRDVERWDPADDFRGWVKIDESAELVEVVARESDEDLVMAAYLVPHLEPGAGSPVYRVDLASGDRCIFRVAADSDGARLDVRYRRSFWAKIIGSLGAPRHPRVGRAVGVGLAVGVLVLAVVGLMLPSSDERWRPITRGPELATVTLAKVAVLWIEPFGEPALERALRARIAEHRRFRLAVDRSSAEAVLMPAPEELAEGTPELTLRLINARGEELWRGTWSRDDRSRDDAGLAERFVDDLTIAADRAAAERIGS